MKLALAFLLLLAGCEGCVPAGHPIAPGPRVVEVRPSPALRLVWASVEACIGRIEAIERWRWYLVDGRRFGYHTPGGGVDSAVGLTEPATRRIYLAHDHAADLGLLRHEILHALGMNHAPAFTFCGAAPVDGEWWYR